METMHALAEIYTMGIKSVPADPALVAALYVLAIAECKDMNTIRKLQYLMIEGPEDVAEEASVVPITPALHRFRSRNCWAFSATIAVQVKLA